MTKAKILESFEWTDDCQGKKDFDGTVLSFDTRYWPRGGGFSVFDPSDGSWEENTDRPDIKPAAVSSIDLLGETLVEQEFEGETEEEVKEAVENWLDHHLTSIRAVVKDLLKGSE